PGPGITERGVTLQARAFPHEDSSTAANIEPKGIEARDSSRMTLQWSPQGRVMFLCGLHIFPKGVLDSLYETGASGPARVLIENFRQYLIGLGQPGLTALNLFYTANRGGVYGKGTGDIA
ncbi:MAG: hypothetical protein Q9214_005912, partial [Letrouitia sp. 1 TL-2023]